MAREGVRRRGETFSAVWRVNGKQYEKGGFPRERDAADYRADQLKAARQGTHVAPSEGKLTVEAQHVAWVRNRRVSRARTAMEASLWRNHVAPRWGAVRLEHVDHDGAQAWANDLLLVLAPSTARSCVRLLSQTLDAAVRSTRLPRNPLAEVTVAAGPAKMLTHDDVLDGAELERLVAAIPHPRWRAFVFASGWIGWRLSEGLGIRRCDVNLLHGTVTIGRVVVEEVGGVPRARQGGKTINAGRIVPLPPSVAKALEEHMAAFVDDTHPEAFLFLQENGQHPSRGNLLRRTLKPGLARAGMPPAAVVKQVGEQYRVAWYDETGAARLDLFDRAHQAHDLAAGVGSSRHLDFRQLRHTAASLMLDAGVDPVDVSRRLGHHKPSFTLDVYVHLLKRRSEAGTDAVERAIREARG